MSDAERDLAFAQTIGNIAPVDRDSFNRGWASADAHIEELERERDEALIYKTERDLFVARDIELEIRAGNAEAQLARLSSDEVVEAAARALFDHVYGHKARPWAASSDALRSNEYRGYARAVLAAVSTVPNGEGGA